MLINDSGLQGEQYHADYDPVNHDEQFRPWGRLYGPDGMLIGDSGINNCIATTEQISVTAPSSGFFKVLVSDSANSGFGGAGTYRLSSDSLSDGLKLCTPSISDTNPFLSAIGGPTNGNAVIYSTTKVATPFASWTPVPTNHFDQFGALNVTNLYRPAIPRQFFRLVLP